MAQTRVTVDVIGMPFVRAMSFAAVDVMLEIEEYDQALLPDSIVEKAAALRSALTLLSVIPPGFGQGDDDAPRGGGS